MARAKNTSRSEARRRARAETRAELDAARHDEIASDAQADPAAAQPAPRRSTFKMPDVRQDLRDLPQILTSRRAMVVPPLMLVIGFGLQLANMRGALPTEYGLPIPLLGWISFAGVAEFYGQMFFLPPALLTFFLAGYLAPRGAYLVGALNGLLCGVLWMALFFADPRAADTLLTGGAGDLAAVTGSLVLYLVAVGIFAAAFAAWYRDFLRRMREQGMARRADREAQERAKRRDQRQAERRALKSR